MTDFGLAKILESDRGETRSEAILGTASYMSPEQALGKTKQVTIAADVYSLGAVLYELLAGRPPFKGQSTMETLQEVISREPPSLASINRNIDSDLETISLKCLEKDPARRYGSAEALAADLQRWVNDEPILARPVKLWERGWKWVHRHPVTAALSAAVLASILIGAVGIAWQRHLTSQQHQQAEEQAARGRLRRIEELFARDIGGPALAELAALVRDRPDNRIAAERLVNGLNERAFLLPASKSFALAPQLDRPAQDERVDGLRQIALDSVFSLHVLDEALLVREVGVGLDAGRRREPARCDGTRRRPLSVLR